MSECCHLSWFVGTVTVHEIFSRLTGGILFHIVIWGYVWFLDLTPIERLSKDIMCVSWEIVERYSACWVKVVLLEYVYASEAEVEEPRGTGPDYYDRATRCSRCSPVPSDIFSHPAI